MIPCIKNSTESYISQELIVTEISPIMEPMVTHDRYKEFSHRLNVILDHINFTPKGKNRQKKLGELFGVGQKGARKWLEGEAIPRQIRHQEMIEKLNDSGADITGEWLFYGDQTKAPNWYKHLKNISDPYQGSYVVKTNIEHKSHTNIEPGPTIVGKIPLINWVQAGQWREIMDTHEPEVWIDIAAHVTPRAYALRVIGDSMTNPHGAPSIPEGYIVIVEPDIVPVNGSIVVARLEHTNEAILKKLVYDGPRRYLKSLNPDYRPIEIDDTCVICGVVKKVQYDL